MEEINKKEIDALSHRVCEAYDFLHIKEKTNELNKLNKISEKQDFWNDNDSAQEILKKIQSLKLVVGLYNDAKNLCTELEEAYNFSLEDESFNTDLQNIYNKLNNVIGDLEEKSWFSGEFDNQDAILSINPGSGGKEAQDWTDMLYKMYTKFSESQKWKVKVLELVPGDGIGLDKVAMQISGDNVFGMLKSEHGVHRLVRISPTDEKKRRHTTFAAVEVVPLLPHDIDIKIDPNDIRVDVFRSSGPGGQSVNTTDSAVRITHIPTGIVVSCQNEKSQIQNRESAMKVLKSKLYDLEQKKQNDKIDSLSGDKTANSFGSQIRNYVLYPYQLVKDLRSNYESGNVEAVLNGEIKDFILSYHKAKTTSENI